jgi:hypothetical protein
MSSCARRLAVLRRSGQAAAELVHRLHQVCAFLLTLAVLLSIAVIGLTWRLSHAPLELNFLHDRVESAVNKALGSAHVTVGDVSIAWPGFKHGIDQPLILRVADLTVEETASTARVRIPVVEAGLSVRGLLTGRVLPRSVTLEGARLALLRNANGSVGFDLGGANEPATVDQPSPLSGLLAVLGAPVATDLQVGGDRLSQLTAVSIHDARLSLDDRTLGVTWSARRADIDLSRNPGGGITGQAKIALELAGQRATLDARFNLAAAAKSAHLALHLSRLTPKALAEAAPALAQLAALDAPVTLDGEADFGPDLKVAHMRATAHADAGTINAAGGAIPVHNAEIAVSGTLDQLTLERAVLALQPKEGAPVSTVQASGSLTRYAGTDQPVTDPVATNQAATGQAATGQAGRMSIALHVTLDRVGFADLPALWPPDISPPTRAWITQNIPAGIARDGKADLVLEVPDTVSGVNLIGATATLEGEDISVTWLPSVPPVDQAKAHLVLTGPDKIEIDVRGGRQKVKGADPIALQNGHVTISGLANKDQVASVRFDLSASVPSAIALLMEPRLRILDRHPMDLRAPSGDARLSVQVVVPLESALRFDDVSVHAAGSLSKVHLTGIVAGRDLDDGAVALDVDTNRMSFKGTGRLAGIQANIDGMMDFRSGPPSQVTQRFTAAAKTTAKAFADAGLDTGGVLTGDVGLSAILSEYRGGDGDVTVDADLAQAVLTAGPLAWRKPAGSALNGTARLMLSKDNLKGIDGITIVGPGIQIRGAVTVSGGKPDTVRLDRVLLGSTDLRGTIRLPGPNPISADLTGPVLDLSAKLNEKPLSRDRNAPEPPPGPPWSIKGQFDRVTLARDQSVSQVTVSAEDDGALLQTLALNGKTASGKSFSMRIGRGDQKSRRISIGAEDAGSLLSGLNITDTIQNGALSVSGDFDDAAPGHPVSGTLTITDFRLISAAALGKLLQALTLYGLLDALDGPGLNFSRLIVPFRLDGDSIQLHDVRAFSPSLGLTARGRMDRAGERIDMQGTVVPAYVFNSLLGQLPLIGGLFSAERGGGLIAMNYSLSGPTLNPTVQANPLSALTPGILRGMFGLFDQAPLDRSPAGGNAQNP